VGHPREAADDDEVDTASKESLDVMHDCLLARPVGPQRKRKMGFPNTLLLPCLAS
jgi:hypothetical protein